MPRIVLSGSVAQRPNHGGHTWVFLQYLLGFRALGWDVLFLDRLDPTRSMDAAGREVSPRESVAAGFLRDTFERFGLGGSFSLLVDGTTESVGVDRPRVLDFVRSADLFLDVMGFCDDDEVLAAAGRRVFLDIDPGFPQLWRELGLHDAFEGYDAFATVGTNLGTSRCRLPDAALPWIATPPPVCLDWWPVAEGAGSGFTSVATWRGPFGPIEYGGRTFGLRVHEFRSFLPLPGMTGRAFEVALDIDPADHRDLEAIRTSGWAVTDPRDAAGDPWRYQEYIRRSGAEFSVAKNLYVDGRTGWFSDRSACYLATGRPVLTQDTGLNGTYPTGEGLLTFRTLEEAADGAERIAADPARHRRAAREVAESHFAARHVLPRLVEAAA